MPPSVIYGAASIGNTEKSYAYQFTTPELVSSLLDELKALDVIELDSAASYPPGNPWHTETLLGQAHAAERGFLIDSKIEVHAGNKLDQETIPRSVKKTLALLGTNKVRTIYAHAPDKNTPVEETIKGLVGVVEAGMAERVSGKHVSTCRDEI
jgi:aflatoxin B1 aldehyde reductase